MSSLGLWQRCRRLARLVLFRPQHALVLFGGLTLVSNWLWFGTGLFVGSAVGRMLVAATVLGLAAAALALRRGRSQLKTLILLVLTSVVLPAVVLITDRLTTGIPLLMHDGAYQTEEAMKAFLQGHDPYGLDYSQTSMRLWHWYVSQPPHPSLFHYLYYPLTFLFPLPAYVAAQALLLPFDVRMVLLPVEAVAALALLQLPWRWEWRYVAIAALFLDPLFYLPEGRNDVLFLAAMALGVLTWARGRPALGAWGFGTALAFKPFAAIFIPLVGLLLIRTRVPWQSWRPVALGLAGLVVPSTVTILPFFLWAPGVFWTDTVGFVAGGAGGSFPIQGYGFAGLLLALHVFPSPEARFPFGILQAAAGVPLLVWSLRRVSMRPSLARVLHGGTLTLAGVLFLGRFLNDNYLADLLFLAVLAGASRRSEIGVGAEMGGLAAATRLAA